MYIPQQKFYMRSEEPARTILERALEVIGLQTEVRTFGVGGPFNPSYSATFEAIKIRYSCEALGKFFVQLEAAILFDFDFSTGDWIECTLYTDDEDREAYLWHARFIGALLNLYPGDCFLVDKWGHQCGLERRAGRLIVSGAWEFTDDEILSFDYPFEIVGWIGPEDL